jgi:hypothetical protein
MGILSKIAASAALALIALCTGSASDATAANPATATAAVSADDLFSKALAAITAPGTLDRIATTEPVHTLAQAADSALADLGRHLPARDDPAAADTWHGKIIPTFQQFLHVEPRAFAAYPAILHLLMRSPVATSPDLEPLVSGIAADLAAHSFADQAIKPDDKSATALLVPDRQVCELLCAVIAGHKLSDAALLRAGEAIVVAHRVSPSTIKAFQQSTKDIAGLHDDAIMAGLAEPTVPADLPALLLVSTPSATSAEAVLRRSVKAVGTDGPERTSGFKLVIAICQNGGPYLGRLASADLDALAANSDLPKHPMLSRVAVWLSLFAHRDACEAFLTHIAPTACQAELIAGQPDLAAESSESAGLTLAPLSMAAVIPPDTAKALSAFLLGQKRELGQRAQLQAASFASLIWRASPSPSDALRALSWIDAADPSHSPILPDSDYGGMFVARALSGLAIQPPANPQFTDNPYARLATLRLFPKWNGARETISASMAAKDPHIPRFLIQALFEMGADMPAPADKTAFQTFLDAHLQAEQTAGDIAQIARIFVLQHRLALPADQARTSIAAAILAIEAAKWRWNEAVTAMIACEPAAPELDGFATITASAQIPGKDFVSFALHCCRGLPAGNFPADSYVDFRNNPSAIEVLLALSKDKTKIAQYAGDFRDPRILLGSHFGGPGTSTVGDDHSAHSLFAKSFPQRVLSLVDWLDWKPR